MASLQYCYVKNAEGRYCVVFGDQSIAIDGPSFIIIDDIDVLLIVAGDPGR